MEPIEPTPIQHPEWMIAALSKLVLMLKMENEYLHMALHGFRIVKMLPQLLEAYASSTSVEIEDLKSSSALRAAKWVVEQDRQGYSLLHGHAVTGLWSSLEVFVEELAIAWLQNVPKAWDAPAIKSLKVPLGVYRNLSLSEQARYTVSELGRAQAADLRRGVGKLTSVLDVFDLSPTIGPNARRALHELRQVRNVWVHCAGVADAKLIDECPWLGLAVGQRVRLSHAQVGWYFSAAECFGHQVAHRMQLVSGVSACPCDALRETYERPVAAIKSETSLL